MRNDDRNRGPRLARWLARKIGDLTTPAQHVARTRSAAQAAAARRPAPGAFTESSPSPEPAPDREPAPDAAPDLRADAAPDPRTDAAPAPEPQDPREEELRRLKRELQDAQLMLMGKEAEFRNELGELKERNNELLDKVVRLTQRDRELQAKILDAQFGGTTAKAEVKKLEEALRDLRRAYRRKEDELTSLSERAAALGEENEQARQELQASASESGAPVAEALEALDAQRDRLQEDLAQVADLAEERNQLRSRLATAEQEMSTLKAQIADAITRPGAPEDEKTAPARKQAAEDGKTAPARGQAPEGEKTAPARGQAAEDDRAAPARGQAPMDGKIAPAPERAASGTGAESNAGQTPAGEGAAVRAPLGSAEGGDLEVVGVACGPEDPWRLLGAGVLPDVAREAAAHRAERQARARETLAQLQALPAYPQIPAALRERLMAPSKRSSRRGKGSGGRRSRSGGKGKSSRSSRPSGAKGRSPRRRRSREPSSSRSSS